MTPPYITIVPPPRLTVTPCGTRCTHPALCARLWAACWSWPSKWQRGTSRCVQGWGGGLHEGGEFAQGRALHEVGFARGGVHQCIADACVCPAMCALWAWCTAVCACTHGCELIQKCSCVCVCTSVCVSAGVLCAGMLTDVSACVVLVSTSVCTVCASGPVCQHGLCTSACASACEHQCVHRCSQVHFYTHVCVHECLRLCAWRCLCVQARMAAHELTCVVLTDIST